MNVALDIATLEALAAHWTIATPEGPCAGGGDSAAEGDAGAVCVFELLDGGFTAFRCVRRHHESGSRKTGRFGTVSSSPVPAILYALSGVARSTDGTVFDPFPIPGRRFENVAEVTVDSVCRRCGLFLDVEAVSKECDCWPSDCKKCSNRRRVIACDGDHARPSWYGDIFPPPLPTLPPDPSAVLLVASFEAELAALCAARPLDDSEAMRLIRMCGPKGGVHPRSIPSMIDSVLAGREKSYKGQTPNPRPRDAVSWDFWMGVANLCGLLVDARRIAILDAYAKMHLAGLARRARP